jgi:perosamine synthetase
LEKAWTSDTKAVVAVDYAGQSADLPEISRIARQRGGIVIEDACHAIGGRFYHDQRVWSIGGHPWADVSTFSFHPVKSLTTGEGGALATNDGLVAERARMLRSHGIVRDPSVFIGPVEGREEVGSWYYEMHELGFNYRITDFQCALGLSQLARLNSFIDRRREIVGAYNKAFSHLDFVQIPQLRVPQDRPHISWHLYTLRIDFRRLGISRVKLMRRLLDQGVGSQVLYIPVHLHPYYRRRYGYGDGKCPEAEAYYAEALSLPLFPTLTDADVARVIRVFKDAIR